MTKMNLKMAFAVPIVVLMMALVPSQPGQADVAPYDVQGGGATGVLCNRTDMQMRSFSVDVIVDLPEVHETFTYLLDNPTDRAINQSIIVPITFDANSSHLLTLKTAEIFTNGERIEFTQGGIALEPDLVIDSPVIIGLYANISFPPTSTTNVTLKMSRSFHSYTRTFVYTYSAKTARYWNGTIAHGHFGLTYLSEFKQMDCTMPNASKNGRVVTSDMYDWDGNAIYDVKVNTGIHYHHVYPYLLPTFPILPLVIGIAILAVIAVVVISQRRKKAALRSFYAQPPPQYGSPTMQQEPRDILPQPLQRPPRH